MMNEIRLAELENQWRKGVITVTEEDVEGLIEYAVHMRETAKREETIETEISAECFGLPNIVNLTELAESLPGRDISVSIHISRESEDFGNDDD